LKADRDQSAAKACNTFLKLDVDNSGELDKQEFVDAFGHLDRAIAEQMFDDVDVNGDGGISKDEFEAAFGKGHLAGGTSFEETAIICEQLSEMKAVAAAAEKAAAQQLALAIASGDPIAVAQATQVCDEARRFDVKKEQKKLRQQTVAQADAVAETEARTRAAERGEVFDPENWQSKQREWQEYQVLCAHEVHLKADRDQSAAKACNTFLKLDVDNSGELDKQEFVDAFGHLDRAIAEQMFDDVDVNGDGGISKDEFEAAFGKGHLAGGTSFEETAIICEQLSEMKAVAAAAEKAAAQQLALAIASGDPIAVAQATQVCDEARSFDVKKEQKKLRQQTVAQADAVAETEARTRAAERGERFDPENWRSKQRKWQEYTEALDQQAQGWFRGTPIPIPKRGWFRGTPTPIPKRVVAESRLAHIAPADYAYMQIGPEEEALAQLITECQVSMHDGPQLVRTGSTIKADNVRTQLVRTVSEEALDIIKAGLVRTQLENAVSDSTRDWVLARTASKLGRPLPVSKKSAQGDLRLIRVQSHDDLMQTQVAGALSEETINDIKAGLIRRQMMGSVSEEMKTFMLCRAKSKIGQT